MPSDWTQPRPKPLEARSLTAVVLVLVNLIPIGGVFLLDWNVGMIMAIYWLENVAIGILNVAKIIAARGEGVDARMANASKLFIVPFFCVHYGMFTFGHGVFVFSFFQGDTGFGRISGPGSLEDLVGIIGSMWVPFVALLSSHLLSFFRNFIGRGEYLVKSPAEMMFAPYARVVALHLTIIFGGIAAMTLGSPKPVIILLVLAKTVGDVFFHLREHNKIGAGDEA